MFSPNSDAQRAFAPQQKYFQDGDSFELHVHKMPSNPPVESFDMMFMGSTGALPCEFGKYIFPSNQEVIFISPFLIFDCNKDVTITQMDIICK